MHDGFSVGQNGEFEPQVRKNEFSGNILYVHIYNKQKTNMKQYLSESIYSSESFIFFLRQKVQDYNIDIFVRSSQMTAFYRKTNIGIFIYFACGPLFYFYVANILINGIGMELNIWVTTYPLSVLQGRAYIDSLQGTLRWYL